ncbi:winged helix-turn-helix domain-containing protein [Micromonospora polyrhachis]|uniref:DNA-binding transcriptional ArsR family regulator n=1 Tax=Micromonospora polyrhachis TaxID=1282883 RepID=A0A7W7WQJ1_9ACTN|nr:winged helix-turn-helix domain-containing protein [Micromonospora polyrhachis]MBB4960080.1 DNA-binding transcriptional ArsR family regulator [Micromonospora polyrhachis]
MHDEAGLPSDSGLSGDSGLAGGSGPTDGSGPSGDELLLVLAALASPHRLRIIAALTPGRNYVSELARQLQMNRPLLYMHLQRLEAAGLVNGTLETSRDGSSVKYFEVVPFAMALTPEAIAEAVRTLSTESPEKKGK